MADDIQIKHGEHDDNGYKSYYVDLLIGCDDNDETVGFSEREWFTDRSEANQKRAYMFANIAYLAQQGLAYTDENVESNGLDNTGYIGEIGNLIITNHEDAQAGCFLNIVDMKTFEMTTTEYER